MRRTWLAAAVAALVIAGCSGEDIAENIVENQIESETGEDVDIDFDDGNVRFQSEDGEFEMRVDDEGNVSIEGSGEDGDFSLQSDDGETVIESEDGSMTISEGADLPDGFPSDVPLPDDFTIDYSQSVTTPDGDAFTIGGEAPGVASEVTGDYVAALDDAGFEQLQVMTMADGGFFAFDAGDYDVSGSVSEGETPESSFWMINVTPSETG
ncbi:MAG: hypothetical protein QNJ12_05375 [Ilumatobacter sp.]|uniref:hypothetical protein n=1 Tax=Ilumatobacter sp. TaxID=1967498 RepID=UPI002613E399|nr:hypothetical protein [Ilumatobacter sp.]MDJ0768201.1 hypothetical protein [Ilumatobacter sp.]